MSIAAIAWQDFKEASALGRAQQGLFRLGVLGDVLLEGGVGSDATAQSVPAGVGLTASPLGKQQ